MCHHYRGARRLPDWMVSEFSIRTNLALIESLRGDYYPLSVVPVIRQAEGEPAGDEWEVAGMEWGLLPRWWKPSDKAPKRSTFQRKVFNARCESVHEKPTFRDAFRRRRCLIPADCFFEKGHYFHTEDGEPFCFAGLWESWRAGEGEASEASADGWVLTCTLLTTEPNGAVRGVGHHRMPVLLTSAEAARVWLESDPADRGAFERLFEPFSGRLVVEPAES
ncbi:MAG: SOS response-associated peptidase [Planctomycetota bacterium]